MQRRPEKHQKQKLPPLLPKHAGNRIHRYGKRQIIPDRVKGLEIISESHKQEKAESKGIRLSVNGKQKQKYCKKGKKNI